MTYNEKKSLYESIMTEIAKHVKSAINESVLNEAYQSNKVTKFFKLALEKSKESDNQKGYYVFCCFDTGTERNGNAFGDFSCGHFEGNRFQINDDIFGIEHVSNFNDSINRLSDLDDNDCSGDVKEYDSVISLGYSPEHAALLICGPKQAFRLYKKEMLSDTYKYKLKITKPELVDYMLCINNEGVKKIESSYRKNQNRYFNSIKNTTEQTRRDNLKYNIKKFEEVYGENGKEIVMKLKEISKLIFDSYDEKDKNKELLYNIYSELIRFIKTNKFYKFNKFYN